VIEYQHPKTIDTFYELEPASVGQLCEPGRTALRLDSKAKVRISRDQKTHAITSQIIKHKIANMHIHCPQSELDIRISINVEIDIPQDIGLLRPEGGRKQEDRVKDRMNYKHQVCEVALTQVKFGDPKAPSRMTHELEVELDAHEVLTQGRIALEQGMAFSSIEAVVRSFLGHTRELVRERGVGRY
jgi:polynucleotide 5'-triphosphatase